MGLFTIFGNKSERTVPGQQIDRLDANGHIPYGWYYPNRFFTQEMKANYDYFLNRYIAAKKEEHGIIAVRNALRDFIRYMEDAKRVCEYRGECFVAWGELHIFDRLAVDGYKRDLQEIEENLQTLIEKERLIKWLRPELLRIIREEPGVVQSTIYKRFDPQLKFEVQNQLYFLYSHDVIVREKNGRSFSLYIK